MSTVSVPLTPDLAPATPERLEQPSMLHGEQTLASVTEKVCRPIEEGMPRSWKWAFLVSSSFLLLGVFTTTCLISTGVGVWGENSTIGWAFDITNFVWWVGIGHAGTLISAILLLFRQKWRNSINRFAEAMTLFAVTCAGIYPAIHVGRAWMVWYFFPIPYSFGVWPEAYSPLWWDFFAISTYATVSLLFWYIGLIPDLASLPDRATSKVRHLVYGVLALGWRGSQRHWQHYETACLRPQNRSIRLCWASACSTANAPPVTNRTARAGPDSFLRSLGRNGCWARRKSPCAFSSSGCRGTLW